MREAQLAVRAGADAEVVAELPVVEVVRGSGGPAGRRPRPRSARGPPAPVRSPMRRASRPRRRRRAAAAGACERGVRLDRQLVERQVRRREGERRVEVGAAARRRLPGQRVHQVEVEGVEGARASSIAARAWAASWTRPSACSAASSKLCTPIDSRVTPAARKARKRSRSKVPGFASSVTSRPGSSGSAGADVGRAGGRCRRREQARRAAADEDGVHAPAPDERQRRFEVGDQRVDVARCGGHGVAARSSCELKSQYGHFFRHHGRCT